MGAFTEIGVASTAVVEPCRLLGVAAYCLSSLCTMRNYMLVHIARVMALKKVVRATRLTSVRGASHTINLQRNLSLTVPWFISFTGPSDKIPSQRVKTDRKPLYGIYQRYARQEHCMYLTNSRWCLEMNRHAQPRLLVSLVRNTWN